MNYISSEEFLKQSEKVQNVLKEWWNPKIGDLYCDDEVYLKCILGSNMVEWVRVDKECKIYVPLLQMHQLIEFVEYYYANSKIEYKWFNDRYCINIIPSINNKKLYREFIPNENNLLQALWKVAIQIAEKQNTIIDDYENFEINIKL